MSGPPPNACPNCSTELTGPYCHGCGQRRADARELQVGHFLREFTDDLIHLDFKTLKSVGALFRPGFLTAEYLAGRRAGYTRPVQLYFICAAVFFFLAPVAGFTLDALLVQDSSGTLRRALEARLAAREMDQAFFAERFDARLQTIYTLALSISIASVAMVLAVAYRRRRLAFGAHLVFAVHYVSFLYIAAVAVGAVKALAHWGPLVAFVAAYVVIAPYLFLALKRVYQETATGAMLKTVALLAISFVVDTTVNLAAVYGTLRSV